MHRLALRLCSVVSLATVGLAGAAPHPFHNDDGAVRWQPTYAAALQAALRTGKPIFIEAGREA